MSERSERALMKTRILAMNQHPRKIEMAADIIATSTTKPMLCHSILIILTRSSSFCSCCSLKCASLRLAQHKNSGPVPQEAGEKGCGGEEGREAEQVSERNERALMKTRILAMNQHPRNEMAADIIATSTTKPMLCHSNLINLTRSSSFCSCSCF